MKASRPIGLVAMAAVTAGTGVLLAQAPAPQPAAARDIVEQAVAMACNATGQDRADPRAEHRRSLRGQHGPVAPEKGCQRRG